jgi:hypothetical protein
MEFLTATDKVQRQKKSMTLHFLLFQCLHRYLRKVRVSRISQIILGLSFNKYNPMFSVILFVFIIS